MTSALSGRCTAHQIFCIFKRKVYGWIARRRLIVTPLKHRMLLACNGGSAKMAHTRFPRLAEPRVRYSEG